MENFSWSNYRTRWVYLNGKKVKLRKYIYISAAIMKRTNKPGWQFISHVDNYKKALHLYGFKGVAIYENHFYKGIPLPENRGFKVRFYLFLERCLARVRGWGI
tara:strand:- start:304 stop:612 length:309 start_codon:yes stop_codon:yes gene_type:complete